LTARRWHPCARQRRPLLPDPPTRTPVVTAGALRGRNPAAAPSDRARILLLRRGCRAPIADARAAPERALGRDSPGPASPAQ